MATWCFYALGQERFSQSERLQTMLHSGLKHLVTLTDGNSSTSAAFGGSRIRQTLSHPEPLVAKCVPLLQSTWSPCELGSKASTFQNWIAAESLLSYRQLVFHSIQPSLADVSSLKDYRVSTSTN